MLILLDDVQFKTSDTFYTYISRTFGLGEKSIKSGEDLMKVIEDYDGQLEFYIYDVNDLDEERHSFASKIINILMECRDNDRDRISVVYRNGGEGL